MELLITLVAVIYLAGCAIAFLLCLYGVYKKRSFNRSDIPETIALTTSSWWFVFVALNSIMEDALK